MDAVVKSTLYRYPMIGSFFILLSTFCFHARVLAIYFVYSVRGKMSHQVLLDMFSVFLVVSFASEASVV